MDDDAPPPLPQDDQASGPPAAPPWFVRHRLWFVMAPILFLVVCTNVGNSLTTTWSRTHPAALIALNAGNNQLLLTTNQLDAWTYYSIALVRLFVSDPLFFILGLWYGDKAIQWLERRLPSQGELLRTLEKWFAKAGPLVVFVAPNNPVCLIAGASGMSLGVFLVADILGTLARLWLFRVVGHQFQSPINSLLDFFARYRWQLLVVSVVLVAINVGSDLLRSKGEISAVLELEDDLEGEDGSKPDEPGDADG